MPATARLIAAMPATASRQRAEQLSKVASTASCVMTVTSSSPSWRCFSASSDLRLGGRDGLAAAASIRMRNSVLELNMACASATGTMTNLVGVHAQALRRSAPARR